jgi:hypothetical protein
LIISVEMCLEALSLEELLKAILKAGSKSKNGN